MIGRVAIHCTELSDPAKRHFQNIPTWTWLSKIFHDHLFLALDLLSLSAMMKRSFPRAFSVETAVSLLPMTYV
jgi:hypothetical protein